MSESPHGWELVDDSDNAAAGPGPRLKAAREALGWSLPAMAAELKLPPERLAALERDEFDAFGPAVFVRGYLRRCAVLLGIPADEVLRLYEAHAGPAGTVDPIGLPPGRVPGPDRSGWIRTLVVAAVVVGVLAGGWWFFAPGPEQSGRTASESSPPAQKNGPLTLEPVSEDALSEAASPVRLPAPASARSEPGGGTESGPAGSDAGIAEAREAVAEESAGRAGPDGAPSADAVAEADAEPAAPPAADTVADSLAAGTEADPAAATAEPVTPAISAGQADIRIRLMDDCWLEITDAEGRRLAYRLGRAGEVTRVRGTAPVSIFLGDAEAVELTVNGEPVAVRAAARRNGTARLTVGGGAG
ncbi:MAG: DUF4115 domain-containing protein [Gammaproteobacteria bacterium]